MNIVFFDSILEKHTVESLVRAMQAAGHQVVWTGAIWRGHSLPADSGDLEMIQRHVDEICSLRPDALVNFRASTLLPAMIRQLRDAGITTMVWLPDDPVLYDLCYRKIVDYYDVWLHCGNEQILEFYQSRHGRCGVNFPFWTDEEAVPYSFAPEKAEVDLIFLGNCVGPVRRNRYDFISSLPFKARILGNVHSDPHNICAGYFEEIEIVARELGKSLCGINIPQYFKDYAGTPYDFPELGSLGYFQFPSRVIQYAAAGLPILSLETENSSQSLFPEIIRVADLNSLIKQAEELLQYKDRVRELSEKTHERFHQCFSAAARTAFLEQLVECPEKIERMSLTERAGAFAHAARAKRSIENSDKQSKSGRHGLMTARIL